VPDCCKDTPDDGCVPIYVVYLSVNMSAMLVAEIVLYKILKTKFTDAEAESIIASIEQKVHSSIDERKNDLATKGDIAAVKEDVNKVAVSVSETKAEIIKWMFIFWIGQLASFIAIAKLLMK